MGDEPPPGTSSGAIADTKATDRGEGLSRTALVVVLSAQLVVVLDFSIVNVALPVHCRRVSCLIDVGAMGGHRLRRHLWWSPRSRWASR